MPRPPTGVHDTGSADSNVRNVLICNWRDTGHPEGGGSEIYVENVAQMLAERGHRVTVFCASYPGGQPDQQVAGVRFIRRGGRLTVYLQALLHLLLRRLGPIDVVIDVQNGVPFWTPLVVRRRPVLVLVHHVHREQWNVVFGPVYARIGWFLESRVAPLVYRRCRYLAVSGVTRRELGELGVHSDRVTLAYNGITPSPVTAVTRAARPTVVVVGRLVPHKRVEIAIRAVARLRREIPELHDLRLDIVGQGWWEPHLRGAIAAGQAGDAVELHGHVDDRTKHDLMAAAWVLAVPSLKEGWGLTVVEAAQHATPSLAFRSAGGLAESIVHDVTGLLVTDEAHFTKELGRLLDDWSLRTRLGLAAAVRANRFHWITTGELFAAMIEGREVAHPAEELIPHQVRHVDLVRASEPVDIVVNDR